MVRSPWLVTGHAKGASFDEFALFTPPVKTPVGPHFWEEAHGVGTGPRFSVDVTEFDHLDVMLRNLHPLLMLGILRTSGHADATR